MESFLACEAIDIELVAHIQAIVACYTVGNLCTELWNKLDHLSHVVKRNDIPKRPPIGLEPTLGHKHFKSWGRRDYAGIVHHSIMHV